MVPVATTFPGLVTLTVPPVSLMPLTVNVPSEFVRETLPLVELVARKVPTVLAPPRVVPVAEDVVRVPVVLTRPPPDSDSEPLAVRLIALPPDAEMVPVTLM